MNIFYDQFATGQVVEATGVPNHTIQTWVRRGVIVAQRPDVDGGGIKGGGSPGVHRRFSFFNVMEIAVARALMDAGLSDLELAFKAATHFAHVGEGEVGWVGEAPLRPGRTPSCPYLTPGRATATYLAVRGDRSHTFVYEVGEDFLPLVQHELGTREGFVLINVEAVFDRTVTRLGYDPTDVMQLAYARPPLR